MHERIGGVTLSRRRLLSLSAAGLVAAALPGAPRAEAQAAEGVRIAACLQVLPELRERHD